MNYEKAEVFLRSLYLDASSRFKALPEDIVNCIFPYLHTHQTTDTRHDIRYVRCFLKSTQHGTMYMYNTKTGARHGTLPFSEGVQHGHACWTHANGVVKTRGEYVNGKSHGEWNTWWPNGTLKIHIVFDKGAIVSSHEYNEDGTAKKE